MNDATFSVSEANTRYENKYRHVMKYAAQACQTEKKR